MQNFLPAFLTVFCLMAFGILCLATGLGLLHPVLGVLAMLSCIVGIYSASDSME